MDGYNKKSEEGSEGVDAIQNLQSIINELEVEEKKCKNRINQNLEQISQAEKYLESINNKEDIDIKFFSPRSVGDQYEDEIHICREKIRNYEADNRELYKVLNRNSEKLKKLRYIKEEFEKILFEGQKDNYNSNVNTGDTKDNIPNMDLPLMIHLQENDRRRIARDLHDTTVQDLVYIIQKVELCIKYLNEDTNLVKLELASMIQALRSSIQDVRNIIYDLRPMSFDDFGFAEAVQRLAEDMMENSDYVIKTELDQFDNTYEDKLICLYRIIAELVRNAIYHSEGNKITIIVKKQEKNILLHVTDNGKGIADEDFNKKNHFGLQIVKNRVDLLNGSMNMNSNEHGTDFEILLNNWEYIDDRNHVGR